MAIDRSARSRDAEKHRQGKLDAATSEYRRNVEEPLRGWPIFRERGMTPQAIECFERAAEATETSAEGLQLVYDLAEALEATGEIGRALAICTEMHTEAGDFRSVAAGIDHLAKAQARG